MRKFMCKPSMLFFALVLLVAEAFAEELVNCDEFPTPEGVSFYYFTCESEGLELSDKTQLKCEDIQCITMSRIYEITKTQVNGQPMRCEIIKTAQKDVLTPDAELLGTYSFRGNNTGEINFIRAPECAMLTGHGVVKVLYSREGAYLFRLTRARNAVSIEFKN